MCFFTGIAGSELKPHKSKSHLKDKTKSIDSKMSFHLDDPQLFIDPSGAAKLSFSLSQAANTVRIPSHVVFSQPFLPAASGVTAAPTLHSVDQGETRSKEPPAISREPRAEPSQILARRGSDLVNDVRTIMSLAARLSAASLPMSTLPSSAVVSSPSSYPHPAPVAAAQLAPAPTEERKAGPAEEWRSQISLYEREGGRSERVRELERRWDQQDRDFARAAELGAQNMRLLERIEQKQMVEEAVMKAVTGAAAAGGLSAPQHCHVHNEITLSGAAGWIKEPEEPERDGERARQRSRRRERRERRRGSLTSPAADSLGQRIMERLAKMEGEMERQREREREVEEERKRERQQWEREQRGREREMFRLTEGRYGSRMNRGFGAERGFGY